MSAAAAALAFRGVGRSFGHGRDAVRALDGVELELPAGSFTAIVGPSGCGKSTLLTIAAGLDTGYDGSVEMRPHDAHRAYLFQRPRLFPWLTARRNVAFVLEATGVPRAAARARAEECLALVGLEAAADRFPLQLSGGMQQRVALARALAVEPALLLMDEPFSALDELTAQRLRGEVADLAARSGCTVLLVTHNIAEACFLADRVIAMGTRPGRVIGSFEIAAPHPRDEQAPGVLAAAGRVAACLRAAEPALATGTTPPTRPPAPGAGGAGTTTTKAST
ncbi:ABC transporter ATP-binding protein [Conexibacter sp. JD483]|uniref:ABC transporter ATP-binding protein n=1 Tax=unclassified Conexibacter TaxID=2627773 RepID=UPI002719DD1B|nr:MULTISPECIES: ABC transporter ATP-binding protein [unclassified Conexibacter]MDO8187930.1 ABC transporter ATP-binding protein [Conexibacter sp. CPCC 205706]MDO8200201.1 ABC transporter ATP-binding protein [Conexibacter sp. CPCC 205762]MDR9369747.1 ABC transporter ATP-binding protein [Conexibacter sp. JD483]